MFLFGFHPNDLILSILEQAFLVSPNLYNPGIFNGRSSFSNTFATVLQKSLIEIGIDHKEYSHSTKLSAANLSSLSADFS